MAEKSDSPVSDLPPTSNQENQQLLSSFITEIVKSPVNLVLVGVIALLVYKIVKSKTKTEEPVKPVKKLPKLRRDFTLEELKKYDGSQPDGRILIALKGKVFDVTTGRRFYGADGPYHAIAGRDGSRAFATFSLDCIRDEYDDLSDLDTTQMNSVHEWEIQFSERYDYVGKLLKPGEEPTNYSDGDNYSEEEEANETKTKHD